MLTCVVMQLYLRCCLLVRHTFQRKGPHISHTRLPSLTLLYHAHFSNIPTLSCARFLYRSLTRLQGREVVCATMATAQQSFYELYRGTSYACCLPNGMRLITTNLTLVTVLVLHSPIPSMI